MSRLVTLALGALALALAAAGAALVLERRAERPVGEVTLDGLFLRLDNAEWLADHMEHSDRYPMPRSMMPGMPPHGVFRLNAELNLANPGGAPQAFETRELFLRAAGRGMWPAAGGELLELRLEPGQALNMYAYFDVAHDEIGLDDELRLIWIRDGRTVQMLDVPHPPDHEAFLAEIDDDFDWPRDAAALPPGDAQAGRILFESTYYCVSCHGRLGRPGSHTLGPHLAGVGSAAATRVAGRDAAQYLYESLLDPNAFIAPGCKTGPCSDPSLMPPFRGLLRPDEMAHLIAYLLEQREGQGS